MPARLLHFPRSMQFALALLVCQWCWAGDSCIACHRESTNGLAGGHLFTQHPCTACHGGNGNAASPADAHSGLEAFPGNLDNAAGTCGNCHPAQLASVTVGVMHTGKHMVQTTRRVFGQQIRAEDIHSLQALSDTPADSLLRKLCAGCHLGQSKTQHRHDVSLDRGGGCLACHLNGYPADGHPVLTARVEDGRCFGCHSRSSRIALSYAGLAETDPVLSGKGQAGLSRLLDGRVVEHRPTDVHHQAGMSCIDCHTGAGLMGALPDPKHRDTPVDIACSDCHHNGNPRIVFGNWPQQHRGMLDRIPFESSDNQVFLTTTNGTPLWHIETADDQYLLHLKLSGETRRIPQFRTQDHVYRDEHERLACDACHAQWAPQCHECHLEYSAYGRQWDHVEQKATPGVWSQRQGLIRNDLPPLGVTANDVITSFVPGMIMSVEHPEFSAPLFRRLFARLSAHTTGAARRCESCHRSSVALGLGEGDLYQQNGRWMFSPTQPPRQDGLPADAWTTLEADKPAGSTRPVDRSFNREEIRRILNNWRLPTDADSQSSVQVSDPRANHP